TINEPADWLKMVDDSVANDFYGYVFHVTDNIDFSTVTEPMLPLNYGDDALKDKADYPFNGTIEGYGNAFKNINVQVTISNAGLQCATGMIGKLGPYAVINNFGVDNGTIHAIGDADKQPARVYATTFGEPLNLEAEGAVNWPDDLTTQHAELNNVWSGADLIAEGAADDANYASGIVAQAQNSYMVINGAYFYGTLQGDTLAGITENQTRINVYNALNDNAGTAAMFVTTATNGKLNNVYSTRGNKVETTLNVKPANTNQDSETGEVPSCTAEEAAWMLNNANVAAAAADGIAKVYFTKVGDAIRFGEEANRIVKYTYTINNEAKDPVYANAGAAVDVATVLNLVEGAAFTVANETETLTENADGTYNIEGDVTVTVTLDESEEQIQALTEKLAEYDLENLNLDYFKTADELEAGKIGLKAFVEMAQTAIETQTGLAEAVAQIDNVVAEIKGADDYENLPAFKDHALYEEYQPANENWLIVDQADWTEMDRVALGSTDSGYIGEENDIGGREYFDGVTFHLKDDVIFDYTKDILPLGAYGAAATTARRFSGIIDGHGYGFENIFIKATSDILQGLTTGYDNRGSLGLIAYLGGCEIRNFGINSGWIEAGTGNYRQPASTFGCVPMSGTTAEDPLVLNNVWNHGWVISSANTGISGLFGTQGRNNTYDIFAEVDGAVLDGVLAQYNIRQSPLIAGVFGGFATAPSENSSLTFSNVIVSADMGFYSEVTKGETPDKNEITFGTTCANGTEVEAKHITLFVLNSADSYNAENFKNVIGITGTNKVQSGAVTRNTTYDANPLDSAVIDSAASLLSADYADASAAAYAINTSGTNGNVYFKLVDGNVRPTGTATNKIVMVTVNGVGEEPATIYINTDEVYTKADLAELLGKKEADITTVASDDSNATVGEGYTLEVSADAEITVTTCNHPEASYDYEYIEGTGKHKIICGECQGVINESKTCSGDVGVVIVAETGEAYKDRTCTLCDGYYKKNCDNAILTPNTEDCTQNSVWVVDCCDEHRALEPVEKPGTANGTHTFPDGWTNDVNIANKQYKKCENCATKLYQYAGALNGGEISVKALKDGEYVIELPDNLAEATLTFTMTGDYTYEVEGATLVEGDVYKVEGVTQVTVKVTAKLTANGGKLAFAMTGAKATAEEGSTETIAITDADAYIQINHSKVEGDATGDGNVNLQDALFALYVKVEKPGYDATSINVANVDKNGDNVVDIDEVYAIVKSWLSSIVATV
ncbi:MAG: hypothetical protein IJ995_04225, partial [Clostridia bacterium]|nr:hypothetical protein [Clostridia bacterium]